LSLAVRRRVTRLAIGFVIICIALVAGEIWITQELLIRQRSAVDENSAIIIEQTRRFRNSLNVAEMQLKQMVLDAHIHKKTLETIASNAQEAYAVVLSNNVMVAGLSRTASATAQSVGGDALAIRDARRNSQQLEIEFNVALSRIRKDYLEVSSNLLAAFETDLKGRSALLDKRVNEAEALLASVKKSATEAERLRKAIEASLVALRSSTAAPPAPKPTPTPQPPPVVQPQASPGPALNPPPAPKPATASPPPAPVQPVPKATTPQPAPSPSPAPSQTKN